MGNTAINKQKIRSLKEFYSLMAQTRAARFKLVDNILKDAKIPPDSIESLQNALASLEDIPMEEGLKVLLIDGSEKTHVRLVYEIEELKKDIFYLENGEEEFIQYLEKLYPDFRTQVDKGITELQNLQFNCFITDRDGTINNYCGRYRSSVQSVYNSVFLTRFARNKTENPVIMTSAPLESTGIVDVSVNPEKTFIYAASKGREYLDLSGKRGVYPIEDNKQKLLNRLNENLDNFLKQSAYEKFTMIGSGIQYKFGQTTVARQDIRKSIPEDESENMLNKIREIVTEIDPEQKNFKIVDTGLDLEIILTIESSDAKPKDFDKADAVKFLDTALKLDLTKGPNLICGDTSSDIPMIEASMEKTEKTWSVFVTKEERLAEKVRNVCAKSVIVHQPDILVTILGLLSKNS